MATSRDKLKTTVRGHGAIVRSWRDLGREGHGREYANGSPYARQGIFVQGLNTSATREAGPGLPLARRHVIENPGLKRRHEFLGVSGLCLTCNMLESGHDRLMEKLNGHNS